MFIPHINPQLLKWNVNIILGCTKVWRVCVCVCVCVCNTFQNDRQIEQRIIVLVMVFNKEVVAMLDIAHCSSHAYSPPFFLLLTVLGGLIKELYLQTP